MIKPINSINSKVNYKSPILNFSNYPISNNFNSSKNINELDKIAQMNRMQISFCGINKINDKYPKHTQNNYAGCMIGGAVGDALGKPVEYDNLERIRERYGKEGITKFFLIKGEAQITQETQLNIFTADGIIKSAIRQESNDKIPDMRDIYDSYQDWVKTQQGQYKPTKKGWISNIKNLHNRRSSNIVIMPVIERGMPGSIEFPINYVKDSDCALRTAPIGLMLYKSPELAFEAGARCTALTHCSPSGYLPGGMLACIIANIIQGKDISAAVDDSLEVLKKYKDSKKMISLIEKAKILANSKVAEKTAIKRIGSGWSADEALAISIYCALKSPDDFKRAVVISVNNDGDSDTIGSTVGNIVGAYLGKDKIPKEWNNTVEFSKELNRISNDLLTEWDKIQNAEERYPTIKK